MRSIFLTSAVSLVAKDIALQIGDKVKGMRLVFIKTASEVEEGDMQWLIDDRKALVDAGFDVFDYSITDKTEEQLRHDLFNVDVVFVSGGNTFYLLEKVQQSGFERVVHEYVNQGKIYIGSSAGSVVAGPDTYPAYNLDDAAKAPDLKGYAGLGLIDVVVLPHWGSDYFKEFYMNKRLELAYTDKHKIILLNDYQYVRVEDDWYKIEEVEHE